MARKKAVTGMVLDIPPLSENTERPVKYAPGRHPNTLANLKPFPPGVSGHPGKSFTGPMVTPAIRRFAHMTLSQLKAMDHAKLNVAEAIAVTYLLDALQTGSFSTGAKSRAEVTERLDGPTGKGGDTNIQVNGGQVVVTNWGPRKADE